MRRSERSRVVRDGSSSAPTTVFKIPGVRFVGTPSAPQDFERYAQPSRTGPLRAPENRSLFTVRAARRRDSQPQQRKRPVFVLWNYDSSLRTKACFRGLSEADPGAWGLTKNILDSSPILRLS